MDYKEFVATAVNDAFLAGLGAASFAVEGLAKTGERLVEKGSQTFEKSKTLNKELRHDIQGFLEKDKPERPYTDVELDVFIESLSKEQYEALKQRIKSKDQDKRDA